jgi:glucose/arabinose dehydrogenase
VANYTYRFLVATLVLLSLHSFVYAASLPTGFTESLLANGMSNPTAMAFAPDGRLFVCEQTGQLRVIKNGTLLTTPFLTVNVNSSGERGLLGIAFDPGFATNKFIYVYYTTASSPIHNRVSRFTANGDVAVTASENIILELNNLSGATNHNGGAMHFGTDGKLYIAVGDNANGANSQTLNNLLGKVLRINSDGTIPADNPFYNTAAADNRAIWSRGLRNPFTFAVQPVTGRIFINDVGQGTWEEINDGIAGSNYGWPNCEGSCNPANAAFKDPIHSYPNDASTCAITGGTFYNPSTNQFPSEYVGTYFFADFCGDWIRRLDPTNNEVSDFATLQNGIFPVDLQVGLDGSLYYLARGGGAVYRIQYTANPDYSLTANPSTITGGDSLSVNWTAPSGRPINDWIGLYKVGDPETSFISWQYTGGATSGSITFIAPGQPGQYEFRYFTNNSYNRIITSNPVTVSEASGTFSLIASPNTVTPGGSLTVSWTAPSGRPANDWIGLYRIGDPETSFISWQYTAGTSSGNASFTAPGQQGQYEFRYFTNNSFIKVATSNPITVGQTFSLSVNPGTANPGQTLTVTWTAPSGRPANDWIGLYKVGDPETSFISWQYTGGAPSGSTTYIAPSQPGQYEFRYFTNNGYSRVATSNTVTVSTFSLNATPSLTSPGQTLTVSWTAPTGRPADDWIGLYRVGDLETSFISWQYTAGAASGSTTFTAPSQTGQFEFRYFTNNSFSKVATSNTVTVN